MFSENNKEKNYSEIKKQFIPPLSKIDFKRTGSFIPAKEKTRPVSAPVIKSVSTDIPKRALTSRKIPRKSRIKEENEGWIVKMPNIIKPRIMGMNPDGTIQKVSTSNVLLTPIPFIFKEEEKELETYPVMEATIFIHNNGKNIDVEKIKEINSSIKEATNMVESVLMPRRKYKRMNMKKWRKCLEIYENNQSYYYEQLESSNIDGIRRGLNKLEQWFCNIIEPKSKGREFREKLKLERGHSYYCDKALIRLIGIIDLTIVKSQVDEWGEKEDS